MLSFPLIEENFLNTYNDDEMVIQETILEQHDQESLIRLLCAKAESIDTKNFIENHADDEAPDAAFKG